MPLKIIWSSQWLAIFTRKKDTWKNRKIEKHVTRLEDKWEYVIHIKSLKQVLNHGLVLKKFYRAISFNQDEWLKPYMELNNKLRTKAKNDFFKLMYIAVFGKTMENVRKHRGIKHL